MKLVRDVGLGLLGFAVCVVWCIGCMAELKEVYDYSQTHQEWTGVEWMAAAAVVGYCILAFVGLWTVEKAIDRRTRR